MEFLRFGSSIPGSYWGCCDFDIIQNFKVDPDAPASIELVCGDGGNPLKDSSGNTLFLGKTYREIFESRMRIDTFGKNDMPNHGFLAILTETQCSGGVGNKWLKILHEYGFEFIRVLDNSVYNGPKLDVDIPGGSPHRNYLFGLFRNIGHGRVTDMFQPPKAWTDLGQGPSPQPYSLLQNTKELTTAMSEAQLAVWKEKPEAKFYTEKELEKDNVPITLAGRRSDKPQQLKKYRKEKEEKAAAGAKANTANPFDPAGLVAS